MIAYDALCRDWIPDSDRKSDNVGFVDGRIVWVDYDFSGAVERVDRDCLAF